MTQQWQNVVVNLDERYTLVMSPYGGRSGIVDELCGSWTDDADYQDVLEYECAIELGCYESV